MSRALPRRVLLLAGAAALAAPAAHAQMVPAAAVPIQALDDALLNIMRAGQQASFQERVRLAGPAIEAAFDLPQILKTSVGLRWSSLPMQQQISLTEVFRQYTIASYVANFDSFSGQKFQIAPQTRNAAGGSQVVQTNIISPDGDNTRIDYVMHPVGGAWKAVDVLLDGSISRVAVQRSDFRSLLSDGNAGRLIDSLRNKTASLQSGGKS